MGKSRNTRKINLERDRVIINLLGEVCWGFKVGDFENRIGEKQEIVEELLNRLLEKERLGVIEFFLDESEINIIKRAFIEVEKEIEEWEFEIRVGMPLEQAKAISNFDKHEHSQK